MTPAEVNAGMRPWGDREIARFGRRRAFFISLGKSERWSERCADRLALRDQEGDDRRLCIECTSSKGESCKRRLPIVNNVLARCAGFKQACP